MEVTDNLKPCPFCGGEAEINQFARNGLRIRCKKCLIQKQQKVLRYTLEWLKGEMIKDWNNRAA